jgi:hypothetical protein
MQLTNSKLWPKRKGYILIITLAFLSVALISYASLMYWVSTNSKITKRNVLFNQSQAAAESATETVIAAMIRDFFNQSLNSASTYSSSTNLPAQTSWPQTFQFSDTNGNVNTTYVNIGPTNWTTLPSQFIGLQGLGQYCDIISKASPLKSFHPDRSDPAPHRVRGKPTTQHQTLSWIRETPTSNEYRKPSADLVFCLHPLDSPFFVGWT